MIDIYLRDHFDQMPAEDGFNARLLGLESASAHIIVTSDDRTQARCSVWWEGTPEGCGTIGHFVAGDAAAAEAVLTEALRLLREQRCRDVLAPMHGNTWRSYRYATGGSDHPPFLMEPPAAPDLVDHLLAAGFTPRGDYVSYYQPALREGRSLDALNAAYAADDIHFEMLDMDRFDEVLEDIYRLSAVAFRDNLYYTDIDRESFIGQYLALRDRVVPQLVTLCYRDDMCMGFMFLIPDYAELSYKPKVETVVIKTVAVHPSMQGRGLGRAVYDGSIHAAKALGFTQAIEALIYKGNVSEQLCKGSELLRNYTLFGRALTGGTL